MRTTDVFRSLVFRSLRLGFRLTPMPMAMRDQVPTANFFQRGGYERNPVAIRHNTVAKLLAITDSRMDANSAQPGARELAKAF